MASVRCNKLIRTKPVPKNEGWENVIVCSANQGLYGTLSPMKLGPFDLIETPSRDEVDHGFEAAPRGTQRKEVQLFENWWQYSKVYEEDLNEEGVVQEDFYLRRSLGLEDQKPYRRGVSGIESKVVSALHDGQFIEYLPSRYYYCTVYASLVDDSEAYLQLKKRCRKEEQLQLLGYDGVDTDVTAEKMLELYQDPKQPFGHELVLCCMLSNLSPWMETEE